MKKLYKTEGPYKMVAGVCGGIAEYFDIATVFSFSALFWIYVVCAIIMPRKSDVYPGY